jgi:hypothetical protein
MDIIWCARNNKIYNDISPYIPRMIGQIQRTISHHLIAWSDASKMDSWSCLPSGAYKLNFDVAV